MAPVLVVRDLTVEYATAAGPARAVSELSLDLVPGERFGLVGESGSGKSTTVLALMRLIRPPGRIAGGSVTLAGEDVLAMTGPALRRARFARMALVPQGAMSSLNPVLTIRRQIADLLVAHGQRLGARAETMRIGALLERVGLDATAAERFPHELSGGMKQRVCIAMAIALGPQLILADEPTSALDVIVQKQVLATLGRVQADIGAAIILVGHDMALMAQFVDRIGVMYAGRLVEVGPARDVVTAPRHPYTRMLIAALPSFRSRGTFTGIPGLPPSLVAPLPGCPFHPRCPVAEQRCGELVPPARTVAGRHLAACHLVEGAAHGRAA